MVMTKRHKLLPIKGTRFILALGVALAILSVLAATLVAGPDQRFSGRAPKMALPTLTCVAPNCTPVSKSALMPIERI